MFVEGGRDGRRQDGLQPINACIRPPEQSPYCIAASVIVMKSLSSSGASAKSIVTQKPYSVSSATHSAARRSGSLEHNALVRLELDGEMIPFAGHLRLRIDRESSGPANASRPAADESPARSAGHCALAGAL